jgi:hypothetical protein
MGSDDFQSPDVTRICRSYLELERGASGVLAWQGEEAMARSRISEEKIIVRPQHEIPRALFSQ